MQLFLVIWRRLLGNCLYILGQRRTHDISEALGCPDQSEAHLQMRMSTIVSIHLTSAPNSANFGENGACNSTANRRRGDVGSKKLL